MTHYRNTLTIVAMCLSVGLLALATVFRASAADTGVEKVYLDKCSVCHGADGAGKTAMGRKFKVMDVHSPEFQKMPESQIAEIIMKGKGQYMSGFEKGLGKDTCQKLAAYMKSLGAKK